MILISAISCETDIRQRWLIIAKILWFISCLTRFILQDTHVNNLGDLFFLQVPSIDGWSNLNVLFQPIGFIPFEGHPFVFFIRISTTLYGIGRIQLDNTTISALLYRRIAQSDFYYYETQTSNNTHRISALDSNVRYSVCYSINIGLKKYNSNKFRSSRTHTVIL